MEECLARITNAKTSEMDAKISPCELHGGGPTGTYVRCLVLVGVPTPQTDVIAIELHRAESQCHRHSHHKMDHKNPSSEFSRRMRKPCMEICPER